MAYFWVQQWIALPIIFEEAQMGDESAHHGRLPLGTIANLAGPQGSPGPPGDSTTAAFIPTAMNPPDPRSFPQGRHPTEQPGGHHQLMQHRGSRPDPLNMGPMAASLDGDWRSPAIPFNQQLPNTLATGPTTPALIYPIQQTSQFAGQTPGQQLQFQNYPNMYQSPYPTGIPNPQQQTAQQSYMGQPFYPHPPFPQQTAYQQHLPRANPYSQPQFVSRGGGNYGPNPFPDPRGVYGVSDPITSAIHLQPGQSQNVSRQSSDASSTGPPPRGPPRKPKQSGHALWVGNLPPATNVVDLKEHFSREATNDIESVFLISKSNCAFVNYRTEASCAAAMTRFHDSRFQGVRLVCRLRRRSPSSSIKSSPTKNSQPNIVEDTSSTAAESADLVDRADVVDREERPEGVKEDGPVLKSKESFFIVKSLTVDDLEMSVRNGIWATQAHNEEALNKAFEASETVYLIFSANKSGEYFGYARMVSPINEDSTTSFDWAPRAASAPVREPELPSMTPTPATEVARQGRIIDDSARGTIFWEADPIESPEKSGDESKGDEESIGEAEEIPGNQTFGKPFRIEWLSTERLPFYRTRGLRNPWNSNREVKIARDGTQLETNVGRRLVQMFHRPIPGRPTPSLPSMGFQPPRLY